MKDILVEVFKKLNDRIEAVNIQRIKDGAPLIAKAQITILGQTSLLIQPEVTYLLSLAQTGDLDAKLEAEYTVKKNLKDILPEYGLTYDEDSHLIFIPEGSQFSLFVNLPLIRVEVIDTESALVSKAVKAPQKNIQLIRQAIALNQFPNLVQRILNNGGDLKNFV